MHHHLEKILFLDIETTSLYPEYDMLPQEEKELWEAKSQHLKVCQDLSPADCYLKRASIYAEFAKVVCISMGRLDKTEEGKFSWHKKSLAEKDEAAVLDAFSSALENFPVDFKICGHNCKEFDLPFLARRYLVHRKPLPSRLGELQGKKPWQTNRVIDTMELWKFGDIKNYTSLSLLAYLVGEPSPKSDLSGGEVHKVYWQDSDLNRISKYCENDVYTTAKVYVKLTDHRPIDF